MMGKRVRLGTNIGRFRLFFVRHHLGESSGYAISKRRVE